MLNQETQVIATLILSNEQIDSLNFEIHKVTNDHDDLFRMVHVCRNSKGEYSIILLDTSNNTYTFDASQFEVLTGIKLHGYIVDKSLPKCVVECISCHKEFDNRAQDVYCPICLDGLNKVNRYQESEDITELRLVG